MYSLQQISPYVFALIAMFFIVIIKYISKLTLVMIVWRLTPFSTVFQCTYPRFPGILLTSTPQNILSRPLAAFLYDHCRNKGQRRERNESCRNDYHQSSERIWAEPEIEPAACSQVRNATD